MTLQHVGNKYGAWYGRPTHHGSDATMAVLWGITRTLSATAVQIYKKITGWPRHQVSNQANPMPRHCKRKDEGKSMNLGKAGECRKLCPRWRSLWSPACCPMATIGNCYQATRMCQKRGGKKKKEKKNLLKHAQHVQLLKHLCRT